jgi:hypothetical protein
MNKQIVNAQTGEQSVRPFTPEEVAAVEAYKRDVFPAEQAAELRAKRNQLLAETDYLALSDSTLTDEMRTYATYPLTLLTLPTLFGQLNPEVIPDGT